MKHLLQKEFTLSLHPTAIFFLSFCLFVFIPNYPYEVMFFFSGLSVFFICLTGRENGDLAFSCALPVKKSNVPLARIFTAVILQLALLALTAVCVAVKECVFSPEQQINLAGNTANAAFLGYGFLLLGAFNLSFFPLHYKKPDKVGLPFVAAAAAVFVLVALLIALRHTAPLFFNVLNVPDPAFLGAKFGALAVGLVMYIGATALAMKLSVMLFQKVDL